MSSTQCVLHCACTNFCSNSAAHLPSLLAHRLIHAHRTPIARHVPRPSTSQRMHSHFLANSTCPLALHNSPHVTSYTPRLPYTPNTDLNTPVSCRPSLSERKPSAISLVDAAHPTTCNKEWHDGVLRACTCAMHNPSALLRMRQGRCCQLGQCRPQPVHICTAVAGACQGEVLCLRLVVQVKAARLQLAVVLRQHRRSGVP